MSSAHQLHFRHRIEQDYPWMILTLPLRRLRQTLWSSSRREIHCKCNPGDNLDGDVGLYWSYRIFSSDKASFKLYLTVLAVHPSLTIILVTDTTHNFETHPDASHPFPNVSEIECMFLVIQTFLKSVYIKMQFCKRDYHVHNLRLSL